MSFFLRFVRSSIEVVATHLQIYHTPLPYATVEWSHLLQPDSYPLVVFLGRPSKTGSGPNGRPPCVFAAARPARARNGFSDIGGCPLHALRYPPMVSISAEGSNSIQEASDVRRGRVPTRKI